MQSQYPVIEAVLMGIRAMKTSRVVVARESYLRAAHRARLRKGTALHAGQRRRNQAGFISVILKGSPIFSCSSIHTRSGCDKNTSTTLGSNCLPEYFCISARAAEIGSALR